MMQYLIFVSRNFCLLYGYLEHRKLHSTLTIVAWDCIRFTYSTSETLGLNYQIDLAFIQSKINVIYNATWVYLDFQFFDAFANIVDGKSCRLSFQNQLFQLQIIWTDSGEIISNLRISYCFFSSRHQNTFVLITHYNFRNLYKLLAHSNCRNPTSYSTWSQLVEGGMLSWIALSGVYFLQFQPRR